MVVLVLNVNAKLQGVSKFSIPLDESLLLDVKEGAGPEVRENIEVGQEEVCIKLGDTVCSIVRVPLEGVVRAHTDEDCRLGRMAPVAAFQCDGLEPTRWHPTATYLAETEQGVAHEVSFTKGNWSAYDEGSEQTLTIDRDIPHEFVLSAEKSPNKKR